MNQFYLSIIVAAALMVNSSHAGVLPPNFSWEALFAMTDQQLAMGAGGTLISSLGGGYLGGRQLENHFWKKKHEPSVDPAALEPEGPSSFPAPSTSPASPLGPSAQSATDTIASQNILSPATISSPNPQGSSVADLQSSLPSTTFPSSSPLIPKDTANNGSPTFPSISSSDVRTVPTVNNAATA